MKVDMDFARVKCPATADDAVSVSGFAKGTRLTGSMPANQAPNQAPTLNGSISRVVNFSGCYPIWPRRISAAWT
jgi:hypothetical protein